MSSSTEYRDFILDQLKNLNGISYKAMMGEFLLYYNGVLFGGIYDDRFLIKKTNLNKNFSLSEEIPYTGAKTMYLIENLDDVSYLTNIIKKTCKNLQKKKT